MTAAAPAPAVDERDRRSRPGSWFWVAGLFLTAWGAKLWLIGRFGTPLPFWDHWQLARQVFIPWFHGELSFLDLFEPHNETRPFFTRIYGFALLCLNGQWDAQVEMVLNAAVHALTIALFGWAAARRIGEWCWPWLWWALAAVVILPFAWENTLAGYHSQFYFMLMFSLPAMCLLSLHRPWSGWWWLGAVCGLCAIFNVGSGFVAGSAVFALTAVKVFRQRDTWRQQLPTLAVGAGLTLAGVLAKADVPYHQALMAHSVPELLIALGKNLAWPWIVLPALAVVNFLPFAILGWFYLRSPEKSLPAEELTLTVGFWTIICALATAYARGVGGAHPQWRYMDTTSFALITNAMALLILRSRHRGRTWLGRCEGAACLAWVVMNVLGLWLLNSRAWELDIPERAFFHQAQLRGVREFIATDDPVYLAAKEREQRSLFYPEMFIPVLRDPNIRSRLPACAREPLKVTPAGQGNDVFVPRGWDLKKPDPPTQVSWGSFNKLGAAARGTFESGPIAPGHLPFLEIEVAGDLGKPGLSLELVELATGKHTAVRPRTVPGRAWERCQVKAPGGPFKLVARDESASGWFAFKAPTELGWMSWVADEILPRASLMFAGGVVWYLLAVGVFVRRRSEEVSWGKGKS